MAELPDALKEVDKIPMHEFLNRLGPLQKIEMGTKWHFPFWGKILTGVVVKIILVILFKFRQQIASCLRRIGKQETLKVEEPIGPDRHDVEATLPEDLNPQIELRTFTGKIGSIYPMLDLASMKNEPGATTSSA